MIWGYHYFRKHPHVWKDPGIYCVSMKRSRIVLHQDPEEGNTPLHLAAEEGTQTVKGKLIWGLNRHWDKNRGLFLIWCAMFAGRWTDVSCVALFFSGSKCRRSKASIEVVWVTRCSWYICMFSCTLQVLKLTYQYRIVLDSSKWPCSHPRFAKKLVAGLLAHDGPKYLHTGSSRCLFCTIPGG